MAGHGTLVVSGGEKAAVQQGWGGWNTRRNRVEMMRSRVVGYRAMLMGELGFVSVRMDVEIG